MGRLTARLIIYWYLEMAFECTRYTKFLRGADCDNDHYLVVTILRETVAVGKQAAQKFEWERVNLRKLGLQLGKLR